MKYRNTVEFKVYGDNALFTDPLSVISGDKVSYPVPTYEALKGIMKNIYWKPTIIWYIDEVRVMNEIKMGCIGDRTLRMDGSTDIFSYMYLKDVEYQVRAHFEWNLNRPELACDRNYNKHYEIAKRSIERGGRRDIFLGKKGCECDVEPVIFGEGTGFYDNKNIDLDFMYLCKTYADESYSEETKGMLTKNLWFPKMENGIIKFPRPEESMQVPLHKMEMKIFENKYDNFTSVDIEGEKYGIISESM